jgi:hypothetical protein
MMVLISFLEYGKVPKRPPKPHTTASSPSHRRDQGDWANHHKHENELLLHNDIVGRQVDRNLDRPFLQHVQKGMKSVDCTDQVTNWTAEDDSVVMIEAGISNRWVTWTT